MPNMTFSTFLRWTAPELVTVKWLEEGKADRSMRYAEFIHFPEEEMIHVKAVEYNGKTHETFQALIQSFVQKIKELSAEGIKRNLRLDNRPFVTRMEGEGNLKRVRHYVPTDKQARLNLDLDLENPQPTIAPALKNLRPVMNHMEYNGIIYDNPRDFERAIEANLPNDLDPRNLKGRMCSSPDFANAHNSVFGVTDFNIRLKDRVFGVRRPPVPAPTGPEESVSALSPVAAPNRLEEPMPDLSPIAAPAPTGPEESVSALRPLAAQAALEEAAARRNYLHKRPALFFLLGGFLVAAVAFGIVAGVMSAYGSAAALTAVLSALPFLSFLGPLAPVFGVLAFAALVAATALLVYEVAVAIAYASTTPESPKLAPQDEAAFRRNIPGITSAPPAPVPPTQGQFPPLHTPVATEARENNLAAVSRRELI